MRDILTGLAIILIVALTTILVAPYFVDWNGQRAFLEARLSRALGQKVTVGGHIDLKLLPTPYLVLDQVVVGDDEAPVRIGIHHLDLELSAAPLIHGEFDITEAHLEEPRVRVTLTRDRELPALPAAPAFAADVRFDRIRVSDGTLAVADPASGRTFQLEHVDLDADAGSFAGPFKLTGASGPVERRTRFRFASSAIEKGKAHARLIVDETRTHAGVDLDGTLSFRDAGPAVIRQSFDGMLALTGHLPSLAGSAPWRLSGLLKADAARAMLDGGELRIGGEDAGLTLQAKARLDLGDHPKLAFDLAAKHLDIDRLSGAPVDAAKPPPPQLPSLDAVEALLAVASPPLATEVDVVVDDALYGGETLSHLAAHAAIGGTGAAPLTLSGDGPGGAHVALDGRIGAGQAAGFEGRVDLDVENLPRALAWFRVVASSAAAGMRDPDVESLHLAGHLKADRAAIASDDLALGLDRSRFSGRARLTLENAAEPILAADLRSDKLDLDDLPSLAALRGATRSLDLDLHVAAGAMNVARVGEGSLETGPIDLRLAKRGAELDLESFRADDLGGATVTASGRLGAAQASLEASLVASKVETAAALVKQLWPGDVATALAARAPALAPADLKIATRLSTSGDRVTPSQLSLDGTLGATKLNVRMRPAANGIAIDASAASRDGNALLRQLGLATLPIESIGASRIKLAASGKAGELLDTSLDMNLGESRLAAKGRFDILASPLRGDGSLDVESPDTTPLLQALAVAFPDMTGRLPAHLAANVSLDGTSVSLVGLKGRIAATGATGTLAWRRTVGDAPAITGTLKLDRLSLADALALALGPAPAKTLDAVWSRQPFAVGLIDPPRTAVSLEAHELAIDDTLSARDAHLDLEIAPNLVALKKLSASLSGGRIEGSLTVRRDGRQASLEGKIGLAEVALRLPWLHGTTTASLDLAGGGTSQATLVASLAGSGGATATDLDVQGADPAALRKVFADVEADTLAVDQEAIVQALADGARGPLHLGTRRFGLSLAAGVVHVEPKDELKDELKAEPEARTVSSQISGTFDLGRSRVDTRLDETLRDLPKNWSGPPPTIAITFDGAAKAPRRAFDVSGFLDAVAARALAREQARIEAYEFDIRERAFFNARLQSERRREAERQKVEDDARRAEAERKARAEAARQERLRAEQAAKASREQPGPRPGETSEPSPAGPARTPAPSDRAAPGPANDPSTFGRY